MDVRRLGAVSYLNARPLVDGLERSELFNIRFDVPSRCADLLHAGEIDLGLVPAIEYQRAPAGSKYAIVPDLAIASHGPVASVAIYSTRPMSDVRSIALDTSSRTSVALVRVLCAHAFRIEPDFSSHSPELAAMLATADAALVIGDNALFQDAGPLEVVRDGRSAVVEVEKVDLGRVWGELTGLPFVYAMWVGREGTESPAHVEALVAARDRGIRRPDAVATEYFGQGDPRCAAGGRYLRDNIQYSLGADERAGLERFYRYAAELKVVAHADPLRFFTS